MDCQPGDRVIHRFNRDLGAGVVHAVEARTVIVEFPASGTILRVSARAGALAPLTFRVGARARLTESPEPVIIESIPEPGRVRLTDGREIDERQLWPVDDGETLVDRLARGAVSKLERFSLRLDLLHLAAMREADGFGSFLGGRIRIFPHQLYVAERATRADPVRWLLADEVGLGKTVEACLVLNHLLRTGRAARTLVVAPATLTVQWLGELWRKYHQVFVLLDERRLKDVETDYGVGFNPFDAHHQAVISLELLVERPKLAKLAAEAGIDLLIVDEAHHLRRAKGHPGNPAYRAIQPIAEQGAHLLLLTATPLEDDAHGFFRLLQLLRPDEFPEKSDFEERLQNKVTLPPCTSSTRRDDIGGLPPRVATPIELPDDPGWFDLGALERSLRARPADGPVARKAKSRRIRRALASGPALDALLDPKDEEMRALAARAGENDPRLLWLAEQARNWRDAGDKTLIFVAHRESLDAIRTAMSRRVQVRVGLFHEELSPGQRDIEVAQFRLPQGPSMLVSTECGGEGRNFEFCTRLILFDLPWNPMAVEQRIGRLDRIGREIPVEVLFFRPPAGLGRAVSDLYESLGLFKQPLGGLERELAAVEPAIEQCALSDEVEIDASHFERLVIDARDGWNRIQQAAYHELHRDPYRPEIAPSILERIPTELEELTEDVILQAADHLNLHVEQARGQSRYSIELGTRARVENLPGVPGGSSFLGTFDRAQAVKDEGIDFFASGHPLVEGILAWLEDAEMGRVGLLHIRGEGTAEEFGLVGIYKDKGEIEAVAIDVAGRTRPEWAAVVLQRPLKSRRIKTEAWTGRPEWPMLIRNLAPRLNGPGRLVALAAVLAGP